MRRHGRGSRAWVFLLGWMLSPLPVGAQGSSSVPAAERQLLDAVRQLRQSGRAGEARRSLEAYLTEHPSSVTALEALKDVMEGEGIPGDFVSFAERGAVAGGERASTLIRFWMQALIRAGQADSARAAAKRWVRTSPRNPAARLQLAEVEAETGRLEEAIAALEEGRTVAGNDPAISGQLSALYLRIGAWQRSAEEWARMLSSGEEGIAAVMGGLDAWPGNREPALAALWKLASEAQVGKPFRGSAAVLAFRLGDVRAARQVVEGPGGGDLVRHRLLLRTYLQEARRQAYWAEAAWAARELAVLAESEPREREWRALAADMALQNRDSLAARRSFEALVEEAPEGSEAHRLAVRRLFSLLAGDPSQTTRAERLYEHYARVYPEPVEPRADMARELSRADVRSGDLESADAVLTALTGEDMGSARALIEGERALVATYRGRPGSAMALLRQAVRGTAPASDRTRWITLLGAFTSADSAEAAVVGRLLLGLVQDPHRVRAKEFLSSLSHTVASPSRASLLSLSANAMADANQKEEAAALRRYLVENYPQQPEAAEALLELGRGAVRANPAVACEWLERLIVDHPDSAVAPVARRLLGELSGTALRAP